MVAACGHWRDIDVWDGSTYTYYSEGRDIFIRFKAMPYDVNLFTIVDVSMVSSSSNLLPSDLSVVVAVPYSDDLMYEPIPYDFLYTY